MTSLVYPLMLAASLLTVAESSCQRANWWTSFDRSGLSACPKDRTFITGFYRSARRSWTKDPISRLEEAECCSAPAPWLNSKTQTHTTDWWLGFDRAAWVHCPQGYFLQGLFRSEWGANAHNIEEARCSKPADHPNYYGHCYNADIQISFDNKGWSKCHTGYYVTGMYRSQCDQLYCIENLRCCSMAPKPEGLDELSKVKTHVMDTTMADIARLGYYLGYGCKTQFVGEDFSRNGDTWQQIVDDNAPCDNTGSNFESSVRYGHYGYAIMNAKYGSGYRKYTSGHPMSIKYGHWGFRLKSIKYDNPVVTELPSEVIETGTVYNNYGRAVTKQLSRCVTSSRSVTHVQLNPWKNYKELNFQIPYTPTSEASSYRFNYVTSGTTTDQSQSTQTNTFTQTFYKTFHPYLAAKWNLLLSKTRTSVTYTSTIEIRFSAELQGFLRWGGGRRRTNYHSRYYGSRRRPVFFYRFGNQDTDFQTALRGQSNSDALPWRWNAMRQAYKTAQTLINDLTDGRRYEFQITGRFDDVVGTKVDLTWVGVPLVKRSEQSPEGREAGEFEAVKNIYHVARDLSFDLRNVTPTTRGGSKDEGVVNKLVSGLDQRVSGAGQALVNISLPTQRQLNGLSENQDISLDIQETHNQVRSLDMEETQKQDRSLDIQETPNKDRSLDSNETENQDRSLDSNETENQDRSLDIQETQNQDRSLDIQETPNQDRSLDSNETENQDRSLDSNETENQDRSLDSNETENKDRSLDSNETENQDRSLDSNETENRDRSLDSNETENQDRSLDSNETENQDRSLDSNETEKQDRSLDSNETENQDRSLDSNETQNQDRSSDSNETENQDRSLDMQESQYQDRSLDMQETQNQVRSLDSNETENQDRSLDSNETENQVRSLDSNETENKDRSLDSNETENQDRSLDSNETENQDRSSDSQ